jgi:putative nucleotidyltransferase with HDIG domain
MGKLPTNPEHLVLKPVVQTTFVVPEATETSMTAKQRREVIRLAMLVKRVIEAPNYRPLLLPEVALELMEVANRPDADFRKVEATVSRDPAVAARVLSVASSALFSRGQPVRSLRGAITRLGLAEVRNVAFEVAAQARIFRVPGYAQRMRKSLRLARFSGRVAQTICRTLGFESDLAHLCGLLHDMGEPLILGVIGDAAGMKSQPLPPLPIVQTVVDGYHAAAGALVCRAWKLPDCIADAAENHHRPKLSVHPARMALVVACADMLLAHAGVAICAIVVDPLDPPLLYQLGLSPAQVAELQRFAGQVVAADDSVR